MPSLKGFIFKPEKTVPPSGHLAKHSFDGVIFKPGMNWLSEDESTIVLNHPDYPRYENLGAIEALEKVENQTVVNPQENAELPNLTGYNTEDAEQIILATHDAELLKKWLEPESRRGVRQALNRRLAEIKTGEE